MIVSPPRSENLDGRLAVACGRASAHLGSLVAVDGAVRGRCSSRVLESTLLLALLRKTGRHPHAQDTLVRYLRTAHGGATTDPFSHALAAAAASPDLHAGASPLRFLDDFDHFTASRKRFMLRTALAVAGLDSYDQQVEPAAIRYLGFASWVEVSLCALKILHAAGRRQHDSITTVDRGFLVFSLEHGSAADVWEHHVLSHLLALLALAEVEPRHRLLDTGLAAILACRNPDGGIPFITGFEVFCTATAGLALAASSHSGPPLTALADYLAGRQLPDGGWAYAHAVRQSDVDDTAYCLEFLRRHDARRHRAAIDAAESYLISIANPDGGFPTFRRGHDSEIAMTAGAVTALAPAWNRHRDTLEAAVAYLVDHQRPDGTFERSWSLSESNSIFRVLSALRSAPHDIPPRIRARIADATGRSVVYLHASQNPDGGFGQQPGETSDVISTSYALLALGDTGTRASGGAGNGESRRRCLAYLLAQQRDDGCFLSPPDQAAPRPLPYDVPVLASIFALLALGRDPDDGTAITIPEQDAATPA